MSRSIPLRRRSPIAALALGLALTLTAGAARPLAAQNDDAATLAAYRLTEAGLDQFVRATRAVLEVAKDPAVRAQAAALEAQGDDDPENIAEMAAQLERLPAFKKAVGSAGMSMREYVTFQLAFFQAAFAQAMLEQYGDKATVPEGISKENVEFVRTHKAKLEQLTAEMKALQESMERDSSSSEPPPLR